jgi:hypothetical protein
VSFNNWLITIHSQGTLQEPLTPETNRRPLSSNDSPSPSEVTWTSSNQPQPSYPPSEISFDVDENSHQHDNAVTAARTMSHKQLFLSSRGVQTDGLPTSLTPLPLPSLISPLSLHEAQSESSSVTDSQLSHMSVLVERIVSLLNRMVQADALTLTNRLKRQHLQGADIGHLSRSTIDAIVSEVSNLRTQFRTLLEDDKITMSCTRKDLRGLFKFFRDIFVELGEMRVTLNDIILDPLIASKVSELALNPSKVAARQDPEFSKNTPAGRWMAPISKLFGSPGPGESRSGYHCQRGPTRPPPRVIPKLGPALSASATTVNVEFSGTGVGKSVTSTFASREVDNVSKTLLPSSSHANSYDASKSVMGIFAGAPRSSTPEPWVVLPKGPRRVPSRNLLEPVLPFRRSPMQDVGSASRLCRDVSAVIDVHQDEGEADLLPPLLERTLRRRGLSDSSIHSTFTSQADGQPSAMMHGGLSTRYAWTEKGSVFLALSRKVQSFRLPTSSGLSGHGSGPEAGISPPQSSTIPAVNGNLPDHRVLSPSFAALLPNLTSWAGTILDGSTEPFHVGKPRDEPFLRRGHEAHGRDY